MKRIWFVEVRRQPLAMRKKNVRPESDFKLYYNCGGSGMDVSWLTFQEGKEDGYFLLNITPDAEPQQTEITAKDIYLRPRYIRAVWPGRSSIKQKEALLFCVANFE